jgi:hypothetical protein
VVLEASDHDALVHAVGEVRMRPRERRMAAWAASRATADLQVFVSGAFGEGNKCLHSCVRELAPHRLQATLGLDPGSAAARTATSPTSATAMCSSSSRALAASTTRRARCCARIATWHTLATQCSPARPPPFSSHPTGEEQHHQIMARPPPFLKSWRGTVRVFTGQVMRRFC